MYIINNYFDDVENFFLIIHLCFYFLFFIILIVNYPFKFHFNLALTLIMVHFIVSIMVQALVVAELF